MNLKEAGTYVLALHLALPRSVRIGRLGEFQFPAGWYLYAGSARGPGGVQARLARHFRRRAAGKRLHWHIDYLREHATWTAAWVQSRDRSFECVWAEALCQIPDAQVVADRFGASDCRCLAHLVKVDSLPADEWFLQALGAERVVVGEEGLDGLLEILTSGEDDARERASLELQSYGALAVARLTPLLVEGDVDARWWAARALAETGEEAAILPLVGALSDSDPDVRACAALALGHIRAGSAAQDLAARLADDSAFVASVAADAISMIGEQAVEALTVMLSDERPHARLLAVRALGRIQSPAAIGPLFGLLEDPSYLVRYYAQEALDALGVGMVFVAP